jgi:hypothetical protein
VVVFFFVASFQHAKARILCGAFHTRVRLVSVRAAFSLVHAGLDVARALLRVVGRLASDSRLPDGSGSVLCIMGAVRRQGGSPSDRVHLTKFLADVMVDGAKRVMVESYLQGEVSLWHAPTRVVLIQLLVQAAYKLVEAVLTMGVSPTMRAVLMGEE